MPRTPRSAPEVVLSAKTIIFGRPVSFKTDTRPSFLLVDCAASRKVSNTSAKLVYRYMDFRGACNERSGYSFLSLWPYPALNFKSDSPTPSLGKTTASEKRASSATAYKDTHEARVAVDATTLWLACQATLTRTGNPEIDEAPWVKPEELDTRLLVELPFDQDRPESAYSVYQLHKMRNMISSAAGRYYVFGNAPNGRARSGIPKSIVYVVDRLDRAYGQYWLPCSTEPDLRTGHISPKLEPTSKWKVGYFEDTPAGLGTLALIPLTGLLRAALEGMWTIDLPRQTEFVFRGPEEFQTLGYGMQTPDSRRYHTALLRTLLATTTCERPDRFLLRLERQRPLREQAITLGLHLRHCLQPLVEPTLLLGVALHMGYSYDPYPKVATASYAHELMLRHLEATIKPYWFGLVSTQRPYRDLATFSWHRNPESPPSPGKVAAFPHVSVGCDIPPMLEGDGLGMYFQATLKIRPRQSGRAVKFTAPTFPVSKGASEYKFALLRAQDDGLHVQESPPLIDLQRVPEDLVKAAYRLLLLGEWIPEVTKVPRPRLNRRDPLVRPCDLAEEARRLEAEAQEDLAAQNDQFRPLRVLLIRRCMCPGIPKSSSERWQQVAVLSLPQGWWANSAQRASLQQFTMAQPGDTPEQHRCPGDALSWRFVENLQSHWSDDSSDEEVEGDAEGDDKEEQRKKRPFWSPMNRSYCHVNDRPPVHVISPFS